MGRANMKVIYRIALGLVAMLLIIVIASAINHRIKLNQELTVSSVGGQLVEVNGHQLNVYAEGEGAETFVFIAGSGTSLPTLDFKPLWVNLANQHRIVVVERAGYGFSQTVPGLQRDLDTVLAETRAALEGSGETGPYVLVAHSMGALEALYWSNKYPNEVKAIIGLDPAIPETYEHMPSQPEWVLGLLSFMAKVGITRLLPSVADAPVVYSEYLSPKDVEVYQEMVHRGQLTTNMLTEIEMAVDNARMVDSLGVSVQVPVCFFSSDGTELAVENWSELLRAYVENFDVGEYHFLNTGHYLHHTESGFIASKILEFINEQVAVQGRI